MDCSHIDDKHCQSRKSLRSSNEALIFNLDNDSLGHICRKLALNDKINFASTCRRFEQVFVMLSKAEYKKLDINKQCFELLTMNQANHFLHLVGAHVKVLCGDIFSDSKFEIIAKILGSNCKNCTTIQFAIRYARKDRTSPIPVLSKFLKEMASLTELELINLVDMSPWMDDLAFIKELRSLKILKLKFFRQLTLDFIIEMDFLEGLSLSNCVNIIPGHFKKICQKLKNLHYFDIEDCVKLGSAEIFEEISRNLSHLETLKLCSTNENYEGLSQLPKLKRLHLKLYERGKLTNLLENLAKYQINQLEVLDLCAYSMNLESASFLGKLKKLKVLRLIIYKPIDDLCVQQLSKLTELQEITFGYELINGDNGLLHLLKHCLELKRITLKNPTDLISMVFVKNAEKLLIEQRTRMLRTKAVTLEIPYGHENGCNLKFITDSFIGERSGLLNMKYW